jgi:hypothetical protein
VAGLAEVDDLWFRRRISVTDAAFIGSDPDRQSAVRTFEGDLWRLFDDLFVAIGDILPDRYVGVLMTTFRSATL